MWHGLRDCDVSNFAAIDKYLLRGLVDSHCKTPVEHLYLEMAALPIPHVMRARRLIYLQTILKRHESELTRRVYMCQKANPLPGDWCLKVKEDFELIGLNIEDKYIEDMPEDEYKKLIKNKVREAAFCELEALKNSHSKVSHNQYNGLNKPQEYIKCKTLSSKQCAILFALRSKSLRGIRENWKYLGQDNNLCPICERETDTQSHILDCQVMLSIKPKLDNDIQYEHINGSLDQQIILVKEYEKYIELRQTLLEDEDIYQDSLPGLDAGPKLPEATARGSNRD